MDVIILTGFSGYVKRKCKLISHILYSCIYVYKMHLWPYLHFYLWECRQTHVHIELYYDPNIIRNEAISLTIARKRRKTKSWMLICSNFVGIIKSGKCTTQLPHILFLFSESSDYGFCSKRYLNIKIIIETIFLS